jgi:hypothetical protein
VGGGHSLRLRSGQALSPAFDFGFDVEAAPVRNVLRPISDQTGKARLLGVPIQSHKGNPALAAEAASTTASAALSRFFYRASNRPEWNSCPSPWDEIPPLFFVPHLRN